MEGQIANASVLSRRLKVLELPVEPSAPCCKCVLRLRHGDAYLDHIWRYGKERLRVAVGNLLPGADSGVLYGVCRLTPRHVYILACGTQPDMGAPELEARVQQDIDGLVASLERYLDLESEVREITPVDALSSLTGEKR